MKSSICNKISHINFDIGISFCIITNGARPIKLDNLINSIQALRIKNYEILIGGELPIDFCRKDVKTYEIVDAARHGRLGEMRNRLCSVAKFDHLVVADDDMLFQPDFYYGLVSYGDDYDVLCVRLLNPDGTRHWDWATIGGPTGHHLISYETNDPYVYITGGLCIMKASVFSSVQWDEQLGFYQSEDVDFSNRLKLQGFKIKFCKDCTVIHDNYSFTQIESVIYKWTSIEPIIVNLDITLLGLLYNIKAFDYYLYKFLEYCVYSLLARKDVILNFVAHPYFDNFAKQYIDSHSDFKKKYIVNSVYALPDNSLIHFPFIKPPVEIANLKRVVSFFEIPPWIYNSNNKDIFRITAYAKSALHSCGYKFECGDDKKPTSLINYTHQKHPRDISIKPWVKPSITNYSDIDGKYFVLNEFIDTDNFYFVIFSTSLTDGNLLNLIDLFNKLLINNSIANTKVLVLVSNKSYTKYIKNKEIAFFGENILIQSMDDNIAVKKTLNNSLACIFLNISKYNNINPISTLGACLPIIINTEHNYDKLLDDASWYISIDQLCELESIIKLLYKNRFDKIAFRTNAIMKSLCYGWDRCIEQAVSVYKLSHVFWGAGIQSSSQDTIANLDNKKVRLAELPNPANPILVDAVFFQLYKTGIARVWQSLLREWAGTEFGKRLIVLDRGSTAPRIEGLTYFDIPKYDYEDTDDDRAMLQRVCDKFGAKLLISSYYTTPITTPSVFLAHDMIPELSGVDVLNHPMWREKHRGIRHACHFLAVSQNTANDLRRFFPQIKPEQVTVTPNGVDFRPANPQAVAAFRQQHGISRPYFLLVGARDGYKNTILFFRAFASMGAARRRFAIVCTGPVATLESEYAAYIGEAAVHMLQLDDDGLQCAYSGALALVYPSLYEGFGMPIVEAMACGCPVITTRKGSIPEVAGDAVLYVDPEDTASMKRVLKLVEKPPTRKQYVDLGLQRAARYSWGKMAEEVRAVLERFAPLEGTVEVPPSIHDQQLSQTFALHQAGKLEQAETLYRSLHQWMPLDFRVLHMLGVLRFQRGDLSDAQYFLLYALALNQNVAEAHFNLGNVYAAMQLWELAHNAYQRALVVNPGFGPARQQLAVMEHNLRAVAAQQAEQGQEVEGQP